jgi:hypothetical protein
MRHWHRQLLGRTQLPPTLSALAISEFFTLDGGEIRAVLSRYGMDMRLGSALQIGFLKMCGRPLDKLQRVPIPVFEHAADRIRRESTSYRKRNLRDALAFVTHPLSFSQSSQLAASRHHIATFCTECTGRPTRMNGRLS